MLLRQLEYFCAVVEESSFTRAAENCLVSQSAVSQAVHALERELGVELLDREGRSFSVKPTGALVARRGRAVLSSVDELEREVKDLELGLPSSLSIGCLGSWEGAEINRSLAAFAKGHPRLTIEIVPGSADYLFDRLERGSLDVIFTDERRSFANPALEVMPLAQAKLWVEASEASPWAWAPELSPMQLENVPVILVASERQGEAEAAYFAYELGLHGDFLFARNLEEGRLMVAANRGLLVVEAPDHGTGDVGISRRVPLVDDAGQISTELACVWLAQRANPFIEEFAEALREAFIQKRPRRISA